MVLRPIPEKRVPARRWDSSQGAVSPMIGEPNDQVCITLMHEMQSFVRQALERPEVMAEVRNLAGPQKSSSKNATTGNESIIRAFELLAPGLLVDFLEANREILNRYALRIWAAERAGLLEVRANLSFKGELKMPSPEKLAE